MASSGLNVAEIGRQTRSIIDEIEEEVYLVKKKITFQMYGDLIRATPVKTGRAQNGWTVTADAPSNYVPPEGQESYPAPDPSNALVALNEDEPFGVIWIVNNVVYIVALDEGHSKVRAPAGMTSVALANLPKS